MTQEEQKIRAIKDLYTVLYWYWSRYTTIYQIAMLCTGKITRQEASNKVLQYNKEKVLSTSEKISSLFGDIEVLGFIKKYQEVLGIDWSDDVFEKISNENLEEVDIKVPIRDLYWVAKRLEQARRQHQYKKYLYNRLDTDNALLRIAFLTVTKYTDTNHRKKSKRYTVSRDDDKDAFYVSARGRLAKLPLYKLNKYIKNGMIVEDHYELRAKEDIPEGQYVKIGSFLQKHFPKVPKTIKENLQKAFEEIRPCTMIIDTDFKKAYDPIYNNHQDTDGDKASNYSCMSGQGDYAQEYYGGIHGCKVVRWETDRGDQVGRCIMYEYKGERHFVRIYGLFDYHRTMINMLQNEMGENDMFGRSCCIEGLELETDWTGETHSMYLDGPYGVRRTEVPDKEEGTYKTKYLVVDHNYDFDCKTTSHDTLEYEEDSYYTCEHCGERVDEDDVWWVCDNTYCCESCANEDGYYRCRWCDDWEYEEDGIWVGDNFYCCDSHAQSDGNERCEECGEWHDKNEMIEIDGDYYCDEDCAENHGWHKCYYCDDWCGDAINIEDKYYCCEECALKDGWVKDGEEWKREEDVEQAKETEEPKEVVNEN